MGRPKEKDAIKLDPNIQESRINIQIEHVKDFITWEKIKKFLREDAIAFSQLIKPACSNTSNHWIDYWIQSGMINKIFTEKNKENILNIEDMVNRENKENARDYLMKTPGYALILLGIIINGMMDNQDFADYHSKLRLGNLKIEEQLQLKAKQRFEQQRSNESLTYFWILLDKAMESWKENSIEIDFTKSELSLFNELLFNYNEEDYGDKGSEYYGDWNGEGVDEIDADEDSKLLYLFTFYGKKKSSYGKKKPKASCEEESDSSQIVGKEELKLSDKAESDKAESDKTEDISFEKFTEVFTDLYGRFRELCINFKDEKANVNMGFWETRGIRFAPFLGCFMIGLRRCYKQFPFNPPSSVLDRAMAEYKETSAPKAYVEIAAYLKYIGDEIRNLENGMDGRRKKPLLFWEEYVHFCINFYKIILNRQKYKPEKKRESERYIYQCLKEDNSGLGTWENYKECIIYIFEKIFAYALFSLETQVILIELVRCAISKTEKEYGRVEKEDVLKIIEDAEEILNRMQVRYVDTIRILIKEIYESSGVHVRMKFASKAIKEWMEENISWSAGENIYNISNISNKHIESEIINFDCTFWDNLKISNIGSEVDKMGVSLEKMLSPLEDIGVVVKIKDNIIQEIRSKICEMHDVIGSEMFKNHADKIMTLYDNVFFWVVNVSLDLEKVKIW